MKNKKMIKGILITLISMGCLGTLGIVSKGFKDWNIKNWFPSGDTSEKDDRVGLVKLNLENDVTGKELNSTSVISFLNSSVQENGNPIFKDVATITETINEQETTTPLIKYVYQDNGGMRIGSSKNLGYFTINLVDDYTFNKCKLVGRNYSALNNQTNVYSCDETSISVNGAEMQTFKTNAEDTSLIAPIEEKIYSFDSSQTQFKIEIEGKRCTLFSIELWTE